MIPQMVGCDAHDAAAAGAADAMKDLRYGSQCLYKLLFFLLFTVLCCSSFIVLLQYIRALCTAVLCERAHCSF